MVFNEDLICILGENGCSGATVRCPEDIRREAAAFFEETFRSEYAQLMDLIEEEEGDCLEKDEEIDPLYPPKLTDYGFMLRFGNLAMYSGGGDFLAQHSGDEAVRSALKALTQKYRAITYEGLICYDWSDVHSGDTECYEFSNKGLSRPSGKTFDFVGEALAEALRSQHGWYDLRDRISYAEGPEEVLPHLLESFHDYAAWLDKSIFAKLLDLADEVDEDIRPKLEAAIAAWDRGEDVSFQEEEPDPADDPASHLPKGYEEALSIMTFIIENPDLPEEAKDVMAFVLDHALSDVPRGKVFSLGPYVSAVAAAAGAGNVEAMVTAARYYLANSEEPDELAQANAWLQEAARQGSKQAQEILSGL